MSSIAYQSVFAEIEISGIRCWNFDEGDGNQAKDSWGNTYGTIVNAQWTAEGKAGNALEFNGSAYITTGVQNITPPWTAAMWVKRGQSSYDSTTLLGSSNGALKLEQWQNTGKVGFTKYGTADYVFDYSAPIGEWVHLAFVCDTSGTSLYVNGEFKEKINAVIDCPLTTIGASSRFGTPNEYLSGTLDEIKIFNWALTATEIVNVMNSHAEQIPVESVNIVEEQITIEVDDSVKLNVEIFPANATNKMLIWSSSNESVAKVKNGVVTGNSEGEAIITVETADGGFADSVTVFVRKPDAVLRGFFGSTDIHYLRENYDSYQNYDLKEWSNAGWKGERVNTQIVFTTKGTEAKNVKVSAQNLVSENGDVISSDCIKISFLKYVKAGTGNPSYLGPTWEYIPDILYTSDPVDIDRRSVQPVWISIDIPRNAEPGIYTGNLTATWDGGDSIEFRINLEVLDITLPAPEDWTFHLDLWQNPYAVARYHGVKLWSQEHWDLLRPHLEMLRDTGQKVITTTIVKDPWNSQTYDPYESMVKWTKKADGTLEFDYTDFDNYVSFCMGLGIGDQINCYSMVPWGNRIYYYDEAQGKEVYIQPTPGSDTFNEYWGAFLESFVSHLTEKGWLDKTFIAMDERSVSDMNAVISLVHQASDKLRISGAMNYSGLGNLVDNVDDMSVSISHVGDNFRQMAETRRQNGQNTTIYTATGAYPNNFTRSKPAENSWIGWYAAKIGADGFLRWAYDSFVEDPLECTDHISFESGDCFLVYPCARSSVRFEKLREGIQDNEKIRYIFKNMPEWGAQVDAILEELSKPSSSSAGVDLTEEVSRSRKKLETIVRSYLAGEEPPEEPDNIALGKPAYASSNESGKGPDKGNDGDTATRWCAINGNTGHWWMVDLQDIYSLTGSEIIWEKAAVYGYTIEVSTDGINWATVIDKTNNTSGSQKQTDNFNVDEARYIRLTVTRLPASNVWASFSEFRLFGELKQDLPELPDEPQIILNYEVNASFNGTSDYIDISGDIDKIRYLTESTVIIKFRTASDSISMALFSASDSRDESSEFCIPMSSGQLMAHVRENGTTLAVYKTPKKYNDGKWHTMALVSSLNGTSIYVDGEKTASGPAATFAMVSDINSMNIGRNLDSKPSGEWYYNGEIEFIRIYNKAISDKMARELTQSPDYTPVLIGYTIPFIDLSKDTSRQILVDKEDGQYLGHPDSVLLDDGKTIITVYPKGHGVGPIVMKKSTDGGLAWSERLDVPESWADSQETPTIYKIEKPDGTTRLLLISGLPRGSGGFKTSYSDDNGETWTEFEHHFSDTGFYGIVAHASLTRLKKPDGTWDHKYMAVFHDWNYNNWKTYLTFDEDGNMQWSYPERLLAEHDDIEKYAQLCEIEIIRSPDGKQLALLARAQAKKTNAMIAFSDDEGETWSEPMEMQGALMGERHKAEYDPVSGRLLITFREIIRDPENPTEWVAGDWVAWVGTYDDLVNNREGQYRVRLMEDFTPTVKSGDCGYAGNVVLEDGTFVLTSYGYWDPSYNNPYIMTIRLKLSELDEIYRAYKFDLNNNGKVDIGDLGIVSRYYGYDSLSSDWENAQKADINQDDRIGIEDLVLVASEILRKD